MSPCFSQSQAPTRIGDLMGTTHGDPESPLRWTCKSVQRVAQAPQAQGHQVSRTLVAEWLSAAGYSLQANRKRMVQKGGQVGPG
jgi:hypothetical protein